MNQTKSSSKKLSLFIKALISFSFIVWLLLKVKWGEVLTHIAHIKIEYLVGYVILLLVSMLVSAKKWQIIAHFKNFHCTLQECFYIYLTGSFINNFLPSIIGGDSFRSYWLGKKEQRFTEAISTVVFDRFTGLWSAMVLTLLFSVLQYKLVMQSPLWIAFDGILLAVVLFDALWPVMSSLRLIQWLLSLLPKKIHNLLVEMNTYNQREVLWPVIGLAMVFNIVGVGLANFVLFQSLGHSIPVLQYFAVIFLVSIISSIPVSINNIGIKEWAYFTFFGLLGTDPEIAITVAIVSRFIQMLISFFALPTYFRTRK